MAEHISSIDIRATPEVVFDLLTTEGGMTSWMGRHARLEPRPGGRFDVDIAGRPIRGRYLEIEPPRRVVVSWGVAGSDDLPPGASTVTFTLTATDAGTRVEVVHSGLPGPRVAGHADGWGHFLPRLATAAAGNDPGPDDWVPLGARPTPARHPAGRGPDDPAVPRRRERGLPR